MTKPIEEFPDLKGVSTSGEIVSEEEHFFVCGVCAQAVDMRNLAEVLYHDQEEHEPLDNRN